MGGLVSSGPLSAFEAGYVRWLAERGFRPGAVADRLGQFRALSRWLGARGLPVAELDPERVEEFLDDRRAAGYRSYVAASSVRLPLDYLIGIGVAPLLDVSTAPSPVDCLLEKYRQYLLLERRLADTTIAGYECVARVFLKHRVRALPPLRRGCQRRSIPRPPGVQHRGSSARCWSCWVPGGH
jgi:integrase/recombinase XerD